MTGLPLVSVYMPTHNRAELFARALHSVLTQDYTNLEVLVTDDGSEPEQAVAVAALCRQDNRVRLFVHDRPLGAPQARNTALAAANGVYITGLDDDDEFLPGRISAFVAAAAAQPKIGYFCSGYQYQLRSGQLLSGLRGSRYIRLADLLMKNCVGNQVFIHADLLRSVGGFDTALPACQDYDLWVRIASLGVTGYRLPLQNYLVHLDHETPRISTRQKRLQGQLMFAQKHRQLMSPSQYRAQLFYANLYSGPVSVWHILRHCPWRLWPLAAKTTLLRWFGREV
jgi:glycosyltransferase involved in cell wall biosynthesis